MPALYDSIGIGYDGTRRADPGIVRQLADLLGPPKGCAVLDIGCGTGNYTCALAELGYAMTGADVSAKMLDKARAKSAAVTWVESAAESLPFPDESLDRAVCTLACHHFIDRPRAFAQVRRVLAEGPFVLFAFFAEQMEHYWLNHYFPQMMALDIAKAPRRDDVVAALKDAGFAKVELLPWSVPEDIEDLFMYAGKHRPELYLDEAFRAGTSGFAVHGEWGEIERGLAALVRDMESGAIKDRIAQSMSDEGDYVFIRAGI